MKSRMKFPDFENLPANERRDFLKLVSGLLAASMVPKTTREALKEILLGPEAFAQSADQTFFLEVNYRDQWDFAGVFQPPSVAKNYEANRGKATIFEPPSKHSGNFYVTPYASELIPHLDNIAVMELGECVLTSDVSVHGHEAGNPLRSPGRTKTPGNGRIDMATLDTRDGNNGNEVLYSSSPTPLIVHNSVQKTISPNLRNGILMRSSVRTGTHTFYHFEANLKNAQVDRLLKRDDILKTFSGNVNLPVTNIQKHSSLIAKLLKRTDEGYLNRVVAEAGLKEKHLAKPDALSKILNDQQGSTALALSAPEKEFWTNGIPEQMTCPDNKADLCVSVSDRMNVGEMFGYAFKLFRSGQVRSVGIDFDMHDIHTNRLDRILRTQGQQTGLPLARLIQSLKAAGLWEKTIIAMYTLDGSRSPAIYSYGDGTKNAVILAGGRVKGGYYGDMLFNPNNRQTTYLRPNDSGIPIAGGTTGREMRVPAADVYKTVLSLAGVPMSVIDSFPDARSGKVLSYMVA